MLKKRKYIPITQGHIIASWHLLHLANIHHCIQASHAISIVETSGKLGGKVPARAGLKLCIDYGFLVPENGGLRVTDISRRYVIPTCDFEDPNYKATRALLFQILSIHDFEWLIFYDPDPEIFRESIIANDPEWANLLDNANLFDFEDEGVNIWWNNVLAKYEDDKEKIKKAIGDVGEKLTYHFEIERIESDGYNPAKSYVKWASRISDRYGFDILSIRGKVFHYTFNQKDKIQIEVKASELRGLQNFRFYISKHEWNKAMENISSYFFYCWSGINLDKESAEKGPFVVPATALVSQIPLDSGTVCEWSECRCVLDVSKFDLL